MFSNALETTVFYLPFLAVFAVAIILWNEIDTYLNISKLKFPNEVKACGHAYTFVVQTASLFCSLTIWALSLSFAWNLMNSLESVLTAVLIFVSVSMIGMLIGVGLNGLCTKHLFDRSETAKLLIEANAKLTKTAPLITDNEKKAIVHQRKREFWSDMKTNFWKYKIAKKS
jgi:hypothetical protein